MYEDRSGAVWIGTFGGGLSRWANGQISTFTTETGLPSNHILSILEDDEGTLWIGTDLDGLVRYQHGTFKTFKGRTAQANAIRILHQDKTGDLWVVNNAGAEKFKNGKFQTIGELRIMNIRTMLEDQSGAFWFGSKSGLVRWKNGHTTTFKEIDGLSSEWVNALYEDANGTIWIGTELGGINRYKDGKFTSYGGKQQFRERILHILEDPNRRLWFGTKSGIITMPRKELEDYLDEKTNQVSLMAFGRVDGMKRAQCNGIGQPAGLVTRNGHLWFPTLQGAVTFDPASVLTKAHKPPVVIEKVLANEDDITLQPNIKLSPSNGDIEVHYTALSFTVPERIRFQYMMEGVDTTWQDAGTRRVARYTILRPGDYTFKVRASDIDGAWSESDTSFAFSLAPHFYQTFWFYFFCILGLTAVGSGFYRLRLRNLKRREHELIALVDEKTKELRQEITVRKQAEHQSSVFSKLGQRLSTVNSIEEAAQVIVEAADELIGWHSCSLYAYDEQEDKGRALVFYDLIDGKRQNLSTSRKSVGLSPVARRTLKRGAQLILRKEPITSSSDYDPFGDAKRPSASLMYVPICKAGKVVGILSIQSYNVDAYTPKHLDTLQALADYCGSAFEQIRAEAALRESQQMVLRQERLAAVGQLSAGVAHEFNNILTIIKGHAALLQEESKLEGEDLQSIEQIATSAERAANLTRQMLAFSRKQILQPKTIELNEITSEVAKMLERLIGENIAICCKLEENLPFICADPAMLEQVILNLALNSRDAMPKGGQLIISTNSVNVTDTSVRGRNEAYAGQFVCLTVADTGCGMDEETQHRIFEPFFTTKEVGKGTGLGLATVYGVVKQHHGWIEVTSKLGEGTSFKIFLPVDKSAAVKNELRASKQKAKGGKETILFVEDEPDIRLLARQILEHFGYHIIEAGSGVEALKIWADHKNEIKLLLTDMMMPEGISGGELARKLRAERPDLKIIYMSGYSVEILEKDLVDQKDFRFLEKPYTPQMLANMVRSALDEQANSPA
ncbi:MAG: two-component regulator propeller domain-containing protein [Limisphaerales bacterium]